MGNVKRSEKELTGFVVVEFNNRNLFAVQFHRELSDVAAPEVKLNLVLLRWADGDIVAKPSRSVTVLSSVVRSDFRVLRLDVVVAFGLHFSRGAGTS